MTLTKQYSQALGRGMFGIKESTSDDITPEQRQLLVKMGKDPWSFLTARDPHTNEAIYRTKDERADQIRDFPDKPYLRGLVHELEQNDPRPGGLANVLIVHKSRQMIVTTTCMGVCLWELLFRAAQRIILSKVTEDDAKEILRDKLRAPWHHMPSWVQKALPLDPKPEGRAAAGNTGSYILAAAENAAERECRGGTASRLVIDEAAFQDRCRDIFEAGVPMAKRITIITTPLAGSPGGRFVKELIYDEAA